MRDYANVFTAIWDDDDFIALSGRQQRAYFLLFTQKDISAAGVLPLTVKRWSRLASDTSRVELDADITGLEPAGFVYVDDDTEELLVRTFVKHDNGYGNSKRRYAIRDAAMALRSPFLRKILHAEFTKLGIADLLPPDYVSAGEGPYRDPDMGHTAVPEGASRETGMALRENRQGGSIAERVVVTVRTTDPQPSNRIPHTDVGAAVEQPHPARRRAHEEPPPNSGPPTVAETIVAEWRSGLRKRPLGDVAVKVAGFVYGALAEGQDPDDIREALRRWQDRGNLGIGMLPTLLHEVSNGRQPGTDVVPIGDAPSRRAARRPSPGEANVADWLNVQMPSREAFA